MSSTNRNDRHKKPGRSDDNILSLYLKEIRKIPLLSRSEEASLARQAARGSTAAKEALIRANLRFVVNIAKKYQHRGLPLDDLISEGNIGLMRAIDRFDVDMGYHFISYAVWWIRQSIMTALSDKSRMIRLPTNRALELAQIENEENGRPRTERAAHLLNVSREPLSLDAPVGPAQDAALFGDTMVDTSSQRQEELAIESSLRADINAVLGSLAKKEAEIIQYRFGLNGTRPHSLRELGITYRLTKERIRQIEKRAIRLLQNPERSDLLRAYMEFAMERVPAEA
ncbi:MAG: RNA polymerase sigma factor RpoD/SigA [Spirochaetia bacterium]